MKFLTLNYIKQHSRIDYDIEDELLELYGNAAENVLAQHLGRGKTVDELVDSLTEEYGEVPAPIIQASLMIVEVSYQHRAPINPTSLYMVSYSFDLLVKPFMVLS